MVIPLGPAPRRSDGLADDSPMGWPAAPWWRHAAARLLGFALVMVVGLMVFGTVAVLIAPHSDAVGATSELAASLTAYFAVVIGLEQRRHPLELALHRWRGLAVGLAIGALMCAVVVAAIAALGGYVVTGVDWSRPAAGEIWVLGVVAGVSEELIFRGMVFRLVESAVGTWGALVVSGALFGLIHRANPQATWAGAVAIAIEAGLSFGLLYALTRSLWVVIGVHAAWNVVQGAVFGIDVSGSGTGSGVLISHPAGPVLLSGGRFGIEASVVSVACWTLLSIGCAVLLVRGRRIIAPSWTRHRRLRNDRQVTDSG